MTTATATKTKRDPFAPPVVGEPYTYTVTYSGVVEARNDDGSLVIGDYTVPRRTGDGVSMVMIGEPADPDDCGDCNAARDAVDEADTATIAARDDLERLTALVADSHDERHASVFAFCSDTLCRQVNDLIEAHR